MHNVDAGVVYIHDVGRRALFLAVTARNTGLQPDAGNVTVFRMSRQCFVDNAIGLFRRTEHVEDVDVLGDIVDGRITFHTVDVVCKWVHPDNGVPCITQVMRDVMRRLATLAR